MKIKQITAFLAACAMMAVPAMETIALQQSAPAMDGMLVTAEGAETGTYELLTYKIVEDHVEITKCDKTAETVEIPTEIEGLPVTAIGPTAFYSCKSLTSIVIPESVKSIGAGAFWHCAALESVTLPSGLTRLENYTFADCDALTSITIPEGVTALANSVFADSAALAEIQFPTTLTEFGSLDFEGTPWLDLQKEANTFVVINGLLVDASYEIDLQLAAYLETTIPPETTVSMDGAVDYIEPVYPDFHVEIPGDMGITAIGSNVFAENQGLVVKVTIPESVTTIGYQAFYECEKLTEITVPSQLEMIGDEAFAGTKWLADQQAISPLVILGNFLVDGKAVEGVAEIPEGVARINGNAFRTNTSLTGVTFPSTLEYIGSGAFYGCEALTDVQLPANVQHIAQEAFFGCAMTELTIPASVEQIDYAAFMSCKSLDAVVLENPETVLGKEAFGYTAIFSQTGQYSYDIIYSANKAFILIAEAGSTAESYANANSMVASTYVFGDPTADGIVNAKDASKILIAAAGIAAGMDIPMTQLEKLASNVNRDDTINAKDASTILYYAAEVSAGKTTASMREFMAEETEE